MSFYGGINNLKYYFESIGTKDRKKSPVRDFNTRPLVYFECFEPVFTRLCFNSKNGILICRYETHIPGWEHSIKVVSDSYPGNRQKFLGLISEKIFMRDSCWQGEVKGDDLCKGKYRIGTIQSIKMLPVTPRSKVLPEANNVNFTLRKITF